MGPGNPGTWTPTPPSPKTNQAHPLALSKVIYLYLIYIKSAGPSLRGTTAADIGNQLLMTSHSFQDFNCFLAVVSSFQDFKCLLAVVSSQVADCCLLSVIVG